MDSTATSPDGPSNRGPSFGTQYDAGQMNEDWEDWLRWDPTAETTSPEEGTFHSGSSKNDSPLQDPAFPADAELFGKAATNETLAPPLIVGEDALDFGAITVGGDEAFMFAAGNDTAASFEFIPTTTLPPLQPEVSKIDMNSAAWPLPSNTPSQDINFAALSHPYSQQPLSAASTLTSSLHYSPESSQNTTSVSEASHSPNPPKKRGGRKRKVEVEEEQIEKNSDSQDGDEPPVKKTSHNVIEKRYRTNLNDKIVELRNSVPSLRAMSRTNPGDDCEDLQGLTPAHKLNKATVMGKATEYIRHLEKKTKTMAEEMAKLKVRLAAVEDAIGETKDRQDSMSNSPPSASPRPRQASSSSPNGAQPFLNVPQEQMSRYGPAVMQQQYMQQQPQPMYQRPPNPPVEAQNQPQHVYCGGGGGMMNKVAMGAMAGLMVMDGFAEQQGQSDSRGLGAIPTAIFRRGLDIRAASSPTAFARHAGLPLLKICLIIGVLFYLISPLLSFSPRRKQKTRPVLRLPQAPSPASPVEVRRKAWLTAMQTVYVPKHFLLEVAAVLTKMMKLSLRRLVGSEAWNSMTGTNKEEEAARVKAWSIAIDAQLAGGDQEVSYYRLLLTLMASGTLPDSPTRLMQKAVHFRVFFWDVANAGYGNMVGFKQFTEKVGKIYWNSARKLQKELVQAKAQGRPTDDADEVELLPDHLVSLVELDCDEVLGDEMIQRAWNLAWNKSSAFGTTSNAARDNVVEDHAIRAPLDAVAAWYANMVIDDTLADALSEHPSTLDTDYYLGLAVSVAPPASSTQLRAVSAKAVLSHTHREANILTALEALPVTSPGAGTMNLVSHAPESPDVRMALTLAKLLSLTTPSAPASARQRAFQALASLHLAPAELTLLTAVAAYKLLGHVGGGGGGVAPLSRFPIHVRYGIEDLCAALRLWAGTSAGAHAGLDGEERGRVVDVCLQMSKEVGGWDEKDSGYGSVDASPVRSRAELAVV